MMTASHSSLHLCGKLDESSHESSDTSVPSINFDCSICFELPHDPVVTMCGHLFCWPCLHQWITIQPVLQECPVCKACVKDKIIPLYGRGGVGCASNNDTKMNHSFITPPRPSHQQSYIPAADVPQATGFQHPSAGSHHPYGNRSGHSHHPYGNRSGHSMLSVTASGLLPALFGIHMITSPEYSGTFNAPSRSLAIGATVSQQQRLIAQHEPVLYWFLFLLGCSASVCSLLFL